MLVKSNEELLTMLDSLLREPQDFWNEFYQNQSKPVPFFVNKPDENVVSYFKNKQIQAGNVLELGCGAGRNAIYLAKQGCSVVGVDLSEKALEWAKQRTQGTNLSIEWICANIFELDLPENSFDFIYDSGCFHHIAPHRRSTYLKLIQKLVKSNGYFALCSFERGGPYGGSAISDEEVYKKRSLDGGLGYTKETLQDIFQAWKAIEVRNMKAMSAEDDYFGLNGFLVGLFQKTENNLV